MNHFDTQLISAMRSIIAEEIHNRIKTIEEDETKFDIDDYRGEIETMISEYINYNVTVTLEA